MPSMTLNSVTVRQSRSAMEILEPAAHNLSLAAGNFGHIRRARFYIPLTPETSLVFDRHLHLRKLGTVRLRSRTNQGARAGRVPWLVNLGADQPVLADYTYNGCPIHLILEPAKFDCRLSGELGSLSTEQRRAQPQQDVGAPFGGTTRWPLGSRLGRIEIDLTAKLLGGLGR
jgi:hypothetical protein